MRKKLSLILALGLLFHTGVISATAVYAAEGNSQYSLCGTTYRLYNDKECTDEATDADGNSAVLTTDADGRANILRMKAGTYYAKEAEAGKGYRLDTKVYSVVVTADDTSEEPAMFTTSETPAAGIPGFIVISTDATGSAGFNGLTGAEFTVNYYDVAEKSEIAETEPKDQWTFRTDIIDASGDENDEEYRAGFDWQTSDPVSSSRPQNDLFYEDSSGKRALPLGWFTIEAVSAPEGFRLRDLICYGHICMDSSGNTITELEDPREDAVLKTNTVIFENEPTPHIDATASIQNNNSEIVDVVRYEDLIPDQEYVIRSWLVDTETGEKVPDSDGDTVISTEDSSSGEVGMVLKAEEYDGMEGHSMTAREELYIVKKTEEESLEMQVMDSEDTDDNERAVEVCQDLKVQNIVTGNLGDLTKEFAYTVEFTGLTPGMPYTVEGYDSKTFLADPSGNATIPVRLMNDKSVTIKQLPKGAMYRITEERSDHVAEFRLFSEDMENNGAKILKAYGSNDDASKELSTEFETVDLLDGTVVVRWENNRDLATITAVQSYYGIWALAMIPVLAGLAMLIIRNRSYSEK